MKLYCYGSSVDTWWSQNKNAINQLNNVSVEQFPLPVCEALTALVNRSMEFQCSIQDGQLWLTAEDNTLLIETEKLN